MRGEKAQWARRGERRPPARAAFSFEVGATAREARRISNFLTFQQIIVIVRRSRPPPAPPSAGILAQFSPGRETVLTGAKERALQPSAR